MKRILMIATFDDKLVAQLREIFRDQYTVVRCPHLNITDCVHYTLSDIKILVIDEASFGEDAIKKAEKRYELAKFSIIRKVANEDANSLTQKLREVAFQEEEGGLLQAVG